MWNMKSSRSGSKDIDQYIAAFPKDVQQRLSGIRKVVREAAPEAEEAIKYRMPTFVLNGNLVHFAAYAHHIGFYPAPTGIDKFKAELSKFKGAKGSVQFPLDEPVPFDLIGRIVKYRVQQNLAKAAASSRTRPPARRATASKPRARKKRA
jgi:uncharacterized protein YdhG (YjbR/CyaY superfamily)